MKFALVRPHYISPYTILSVLHYIETELSCIRVGCNTHFSNQLMEAGVILEHGRCARLNVEEEIRQGVGPVTTLFQHSVELIVVAALRNLRNVILSTVQVRLKLKYVRV